MSIGNHVEKTRIYIVVKSCAAVFSGTLSLIAYHGHTYLKTNTNLKRPVSVHYIVLYIVIKLNTNNLPKLM